MNLIIIAALVAATFADKLDRTYLPPASAKSAGGNPGSLKTPFASNSLNGGLGSLPKGSYNNDFQGVVVDAVAPGTRASGAEETGLGAPRTSYGSTNSKVGAAAFKTNPSAFGQASVAEDQNTGTFNQGFANQAPGSVTPERPRAALDRAANTVKFDSQVGPESYSYSFETDNGIFAEENGLATNGVQAQGGFSYTGDDGQVYAVTYTADEGGYIPKGDHLPTPPPIPEEILKSLEQNARDEAAGLVDDGSYDAQKYNTGGDYADNGDTNGKYRHQSSKFGGAGETDVTASGSFISQNNQIGRPGQSSQSAQAFGSDNEVENPQQNSVNTQGISGFSGQFGSSQSEKAFGNGDIGQTYSNGHRGHSQGNNGFSSNFESSSIGHDSSTSGSFENTARDPQSESSEISGPTSTSEFAQASQGFSRPTGNNGFPSQGQTGFNSNRFGQTSQFSSNSNQGSHFGNKNEYLPPANGFGQKGPQNKRPGFQSASQFDQSTTHESTKTDQSFPTQTSGNRPQGSNSALLSTGIPNANRFSGQFGVQQNQGLTQNQPSNNGGLSSSGNNFEQFQGFGSRLQQNQGLTQNQPSNNPQLTSSGGSFEQLQGLGNKFNSKNEYLPPSNNFGSNNIPVQKQPQSNNQFNQKYNANPQFSTNLPSSQNQESFSNSASSSVPTQQPSFGFNSQTRPQSNVRPNYQSNNRFPSSQNNVQTQFTSSSPGLQTGSQASQPDQFQNQFNVPKATSQPETELTTPLESNGPQRVNDASSTTSFNSRPSQSSFGASSLASTTPFPSFGAPSTPRSQKSGSRPFGTIPSQETAFPSQPSPGQYQQYQTNSQFGTSSSFSQDNDVQGAPSTPSPQFTQQSQGPDESYYYRQPSKPFGTPQGSMFPNVQPNQFNRVAQGPQNNQLSFPSQSQNNQFQGSNKYPMPPSIAPTVSSQSQFKSNSFSAQYNGITQASISPFPSQAPTQPTQFNQQGQFGRPTNQPMKPFSQIPSRPAFGQTSMTQASFSQTTATPFVQKPERQQIFQSQQSLTNEPEPTESSQQTPSQQYNGELYEYNKPPEVVPAPENNEPSGIAMFAVNEQNKFGAQNSRPQPGQNEYSQTSIPQFGQTQGSRPFSASLRPQFGQKIQQSGFGSQSSAQATSQPQFTQTFASTSTQDQSNTQNYPAESQFGAEIKKTPCCQGSQQSDSFPSRLRPLQGFGSQAQAQFGQTSIPGSQGLRPEATVSSFAGKGEQFGGPRKPPSFDEKTGYHY